MCIKYKKNALSFPINEMNYKEKSIFIVCVIKSGNYTDYLEYLKP